MSSGYSGNLRAFLLVPERDPPLDTLEEIVNNEGDIPWDFMPFESEAEKFLIESEDRNVRLFWDKKIVVGWEELLTDRVLL